MKQLKNTYKEVINETIEIGIRNDATNIIINESNELKEQIDSFKIKVPLIGAFNAGKSSLINKFLDIDILPTDIIPETTIATEIRYGEG